MTVIAKKIARAAEQPSDRRDVGALANDLLPDLTTMLAAWLGMDVLDNVSVSGEWAKPGELKTEDIVISRQGRTKSVRAFAMISQDLAIGAVGRLLRIPVASDPQAIASLKPFLSETVLSLASKLQALPIMDPLTEGRDHWSIVPDDELMPLLGNEDLARVTMEFAGPDGEMASLKLLLTPELLGCVETEESDLQTSHAKTTRQSPRLGPCHVDVKAIADRIRMSVAECARLEIGRVVPLPGLRFDQLELTVEMGEGPVPLVEASLGADQGVKAVRLNRGLDPDFKTPPHSPKSTDAEAQTDSGRETVHA